MALHSITIPEMGESVRNGVVAKWHKPDGAMVKRDEVVMDLETDKITAEITAPAAGKLSHAAKVGDTVNVGVAVGKVDDSVTAAAEVAVAAPAPASSPVAAKPAAAPVLVGAAAGGNGHSAASGGDIRATPLARKLADEVGVPIGTLHGTGPGGKVREQDVRNALTPAAKAPTAAAAAATNGQSTSAAAKRTPMSPLRQRIAQRLVEAQHAAAMLTTFNEVDMTAVMELRKKYKEEFEKKQGVGLGFMSFFVKAAAAALRQFPTVNAYLATGANGQLEIEHHDYVNISVAVSTPKGLTVPVLRNCQSLSFAQIEAGIKDLATKARDGKLGLDDLQGGTFTITNGGVFGSLISTPILNAPQSAILGMHAIKNRPMEHPDKPGEIALRPMMYLALSYDHRLLDGSDAVQFLVAMKNGLERPERLLIGL